MSLARLSKIYIIEIKNMYNFYINGRNYKSTMK